MRENLITDRIVIDVMAFTNASKSIKEADLVIGAVLIPGAAAPKLISKEDLKRMYMPNLEAGNIDTSTTFGGANIDIVSKKMNGSAYVKLGTGAGLNSNVAGLDGDKMKKYV